MIRASDVTINRISIHTPAKGVTQRASRVFSLLPISIHTPAKGVTFPYFKSLSGISISIHTPAKGVTTGSADPAAKS